jgi:hypothetical protein
VTPVGTAPDQLFTDDDAGIDSDQHALANRFGTFTLSVAEKNENGQTIRNLNFGKRNGATLSYIDADGDLVKLRMEGAGSGEVSTSGGILDLAMTGTKADSKLKVNVTGAGDGRLDFRNIDVSQSIGSVPLGLADITGRVVFSGGARTVVLGDVNSDSPLILGAFSSSTTRANISLGSVQDLSILSQNAARHRAGGSVARYHGHERRARRALFESSPDHRQYHSSR